MTVPALSFDRVTKVYSTGTSTRTALAPMSFRVAAGRTVAVVGRSGSGKSTLLHLAAGIDLPTGGEVSVHGRRLSALSDRERSLMRRDEIGMVFQFFHLLPHLSVRDNVRLPDLIGGGSRAGRDRATELLTRVGLADRADDPVDQLSGGEMQRVAICRALLRAPRLLLADEPTGNLDDEHGQAVMDLMLRLASAERATVMYVTHSAEIAALADERWRLHSGTLELV